MKIYTSKKDFFKETKEIQKAVVTSIDDLYKRIQAYECQSVEFNRIFNDDKIKYDQHGAFFTYKAQKCNMQLRILYAFFYSVDGSPTVLIADYFIKKKNNKAYIKQFEWADKINVSNLLNVARPIVC